MQVSATLDPAFAAVSNRLAQAGLTAPGRTGASIADIRAAQDRIGAWMAQHSIPLDDERDVALPLIGGASLPARLYRPRNQGRTGLLVYLHGGGFSQGSLSTWDPLARQIARGSGCSVLSIGYSLAPEHPFPRAFDDVVEAVRALPALADTLQIDPAKLALGGDSAGANLALAAAMALRDTGGPTLCRLLLFYGVYSSDLTTASWQTLGDGRFGLSCASMRQIWRSYCGNEEPTGDWRITPLEGDCHGLPPVWACVGTLDPLLDDSRRLQHRLAEAGVTSVLRICAGLPHAFVRHVTHVPAVDATIDDAIHDLRRAMGSEETQ